MDLGIAIVFGALLASFLVALALRRLRVVNRQLLYVFVAYVQLIPLFALVYWKCYQSEPRRFVVAEPLQEAHAVDVQAHIEHDIQILLTQLDALQELADTLRSPAVRHERATRGPLGTVRYRTRRFACDFDQGFWLGNVRDTLFRTDVLTILRGGDIVFADTFRVAGPALSGSTAQEQARSTERWFAPDPRRFLAVVLALEERSRLAMARDSQLLEVAHVGSVTWSYWDFLYFSATTQTTVGFGDILPRTTGVRLVVVAQVLLGLLMIGVIVNVVIVSRQH